MPELIVPVLTGWGLSATAASIVANLGVSVALTAASQALGRSQKGAADASREIARPDSLPAYRHVYGRSVRVQGSPAPLWVVDDGVLYGCIILNSRPSEGGSFAMFLDRRPVSLSGDIYDFGDYQSGTATVLEGDTYVDVIHGLRGAPNGDGMVAWSDDGPLTISTVGSTTLRISLDAAAPAGGVEVTWRAAKGTDGGVATEAPFASHCNCWLGLGSQSHPPARILEEVGDLRGLDAERFWPSDRWSNCTVLWVRLVAGDPEERANRWPSTPPLIEAETNWSLVWDPRDPEQDPDDPGTWGALNNQALCLLDALRHNPIAQYQLSQIRLQDFEEAADIADQLVALKAGGAERRYRVGSLIAYRQDVELADSIKPLALAGAGAVIRVGGAVGYAPGVWSEPEITLTECLRDAPIQFQRTTPTRDLPGALVVEHPDPAANWETSAEQPYQVDADWDGSSDRIRREALSAVFSRTQAQRVQKIMAERMKRQKRLTATFPPAALEAIAGGRVTLALPREADRRNGSYRVAQSHPAQWLEGDDGVALRLPLSLGEDAAAIYAWDPATDEVEGPSHGTPPIDPFIGTPEWDSLTVTGSNIDLAIIWPGVWSGMTFAPTAAEVQAQYRTNQSSFWLEAGTFVRTDDTGALTFTLGSSGNSYDFRIRGKDTFGVSPSYSGWVYAYAAQIGFTLSAPAVDTVTAGSGQIALSITAPSEAPCAGVQIWVGVTADPEVAILYAEIASDPSDPVAYTATGLPSGVLHYVFVRAVTASGAVSPWAATETATPT